MKTIIFLNACIKYILINVLWMALERIIYGLSLIHI